MGVWKCSSVSLLQNISEQRKKAKFLVQAVPQGKQYLIGNRETLLATCMQSNLNICISLEYILQDWLLYEREGGNGTMADSYLVEHIM